MMIRNLAILVGAVVIITALTVATPYWVQSSKSDFAVLKEGAPVDNFNFKTIDGSAYALNDFKGAPVLVHFWATWCPPCIVEFPALVRAAKKNPDIIVIAISTDRARASLDRFLSRYDIPNNFHVVFDADKMLTEQYFGTYQLPETLVLNADLTLEQKMIGAYTGWRSYKF
ncbi:MAG: hypothetical protein COB76_02950 [Alphaproteobacteria bacterium]|nr:MAG: hypothetical protein COB76_02950 [Alphaproteobacteria bacterium]